MTARRTIGSQWGLTKHRVDRVNLSNTYRVIVLVNGLRVRIKFMGQYSPPPLATAGLLVSFWCRLTRVVPDKI